jgi:tetratricopeptide (TPR) repeat protein
MAFNKAKVLQEAERLVSLGKTSQAITQYLHIVENDPADLILLNTIGDLYVREKKVPEALREFNRLAEAYVREGFTVKAIAIYKKVSKLSPSAVDPLLKLAELYTLQGLSQEAREQYTQAINFYRKRKQNDKVLEMLRKVVQIDPENAANRARLAEFCEQSGGKAEAAQAYLESAQLALRQGESAGAEMALKKAAKLDPKNPRVRLFKARVALASKRPEEAEKIITSDPELKDSPASHEVLLEASLASRQIEKARKLVLGVYRANPADFRPLASYVSLCIEKGDPDAALKPLLEVADGLIEQKNTGPLTDVLRQIWNKESSHLPTLELLYRVCERTSDELTLPEVLEALGHAYTEAGNLEKAASAFQKLVEREPQDEEYKKLLKQVLQRQGKEFVLPSPEVLENVEMALTADAEVRPEPPSAPIVDEKEAAAVKEALENSDLFARYGLVDKAVGELERALETYPDQVDIHERILEISQRTNTARAGVAAAALVRIFTARGDPESARRYEEMARACGAPIPATPRRKRTAEFDLSAGIQAGEPAASQSEPASAPPPQDVPLRRGGPRLPATPVGAGEEGFDLSEDLAAFSASPESQAVEEQVLPFNYEEGQVEIDFYLEQGFAEEAEKAVQAYEKKYPGNPQVSELRRRLEERAAAAPAEEATLPAASGPSPEVWPPSPASPPEAAPLEAVPPARPPTAGAVVLDSLASDLASSLEGIEEGAGPPSSRTGVQSPPAQSPGSATPLSGLLEELGEPAEAQAAREDPETHYNLGVAFREMGLLDEAIGEFQKVVKSTGKSKFPPHFLQACTLLAASFMDKKMPAIAAKWYLRALQMPDLDEEATLALHYDLGVAYEQSGETRTALEKFTEVYSQNIDYRDVAEKIRLLQQKVS